MSISDSVIIFEKLMKCQQLLGKFSTWSLRSFCFTQALGKKIQWLLRSPRNFLNNVPTDDFNPLLVAIIYTLTSSMWRASKQF